MKSFQRINSFYKEQERLMWAFAGFVTAACVPRCDTAILKVAKLIFLQVTNLLNSYCFLREVGHSILIWLDKSKHTVWHAQGNIHFMSAEQTGHNPASHLISACDFQHQLLGPARSVIHPPGLHSWLPDSGSHFQSKSNQNSPVSLRALLFCLFCSHIHIFSPLSCSYVEFLFSSYSVASSSLVDKLDTWYMP